MIGRTGASAQEHVVREELTRDLGLVKEDACVMDQDIRQSNVCSRIVQVEETGFPVSCLLLMSVLVREPISVSFFVQFQNVPNLLTLHLSWTVPRPLMSRRGTD